jgi:hypothetical protein
MNYIGSIRYDQHGRKRKTKALAPRRKAKQVFTPLKKEKTFAEQRMEEFNNKYPSHTGNSRYEVPEDTSWKAEESKNFTVAPAYNKGAYQVIPHNDVEHIGK